jgi:hypothetical protein
MRWPPSIAATMMTFAGIGNGAVPRGGGAGVPARAWIDIFLDPVVRGQGVGRDATLIPLPRA